ncbi:MAG: hypothetical protein WEB60_06675 [Terrimicrobiaceae bacterium]
MNSYFKQLGDEVLSAWKLKNFSLPAFPALATEALEKNPPSDFVDIEEMIRDVLLNDEQPNQSMSGFGQPELIVYNHPRFYIQVLFWLDGTTDIHQHEFSGAFHVLGGSSLHSHFEFLNVNPITAHFRLGDLRLLDTQVLETGRTVPIISGTSCIHSLFHLETPSLTVVVRTQSDPGTGPQFTYLPPHVGLDPVQEDALTMRRKQLLDALEHVGDPAYADLLLEMMEDLDFERGFFMLQNGHAHLRRLGAWEDVWEAFAKKHGSLADGIPCTLDEIVRRDTISGMRGMIEEPEHRFFLALLLNIPERSRILELVGQRVEGDPVSTILRWAEELMVESPEGLWILDAGFPEELEVPPENQQPLFLTALRSLIDPSAPGDKQTSKALKEALLNSSLSILAH